MLILYICKVSSIHQKTSFGKASPEQIPSEVLPKLFIRIYELGEGSALGG
ncbi:hypothetical protein [Nostoc sp. C117]